MGIIKQILSEAVINSKGWVEVLQFIKDNGYGDLLLPHKIVGGRYIQYNLEGYKYNWYAVNADDSIEELMDLLSGSKYGVLAQNAAYYQKVGIDDKYYVWFNMDIKAKIIGSGFFNYAHMTKDGKVRKSPGSDNDNTTLSELLPYLSEEYPDLFFRTIKGKNGAMVQDKARLVDVSIINIVNKLGLMRIVHDVIRKNRDIGIIYEKIYEATNQDDELTDRVIEFLYEYEYLYNEISDLSKTDEVVIEYQEMSGIAKLDLHMNNIGYDKDDILKAFDI